MFRKSFRATRAGACALALVAMLASAAHADAELARVCARLVAEVDARWGSAAATSLEAELRFPNDVVQRALWLRTQYDEPMAGRVIPVRVEKTRATGEFASDR